MNRYFCEYKTGRCEYVEQLLQENKRIKALLVLNNNNKECTGFGKEYISKDLLIEELKKRIKHFVDWRVTGRCMGNKIELAKNNAIIEVLLDFLFELGAK